jgi:hypothetical protein
MQWIDMAKVFRANYDERVILTGKIQVFFTVVANRSALHIAHLEAKITRYSLVRLIVMRL